jgi:hypothetical protein
MKDDEGGLHLGHVAIQPIWIGEAKLAASGRTKLGFNNLAKEMLREPRMRKTAKVLLQV